MEFPRDPPAFFILKLQQTRGKISQRLFGLAAGGDIAIYFKYPLGRPPGSGCSDLAAFHPQTLVILRALRQLTFPDARLE